MLITETSRKIKARQTLYGKRNAVKQFAIMTPENPMGEALTAEENSKRRKEFERLLNEYGLYAYPVHGVYGIKEHSYMIFNISLKAAMYLARDFDQISFIMAFVKGENKVEYQYWEKNASEQDKNAKERDKQYINTQTKEEIIRFDNDTVDNYTEIGKGFRFKIPYQFGEAVEAYNDIFDFRCQKSKLYEQEYQGLIEESISDKWIPRKQAFYRSLLYGSRYMGRYESPEALEMNEIISK